MAGIQEIEQAIRSLNADELYELYGWLDQHGPHPLDSRIELDLQSGRLDAAIEAALRDQSSGQVRAL